MESCVLRTRANQYSRKCITRHLLLIGYRRVTETDRKWLSLLFMDGRSGEWARFELMLRGEWPNSYPLTNRTLSKTWWYPCQENSHCGGNIICKHLYWNRFYTQICHWYLLNWLKTQATSFKTDWYPFDRIIEQVGRNHRISAARRRA